MTVSCPIDLTRQLIQCESVTPVEGGAITLIEERLKKLGFRCERLIFGEGQEAVHNLYARKGTTEPHFCYAGHTDVVPIGNLESWTYPPFEARIVDGVLYGRGAVDMKGSIGAFLAAAENFIAGNPDFKGSISFLITADEEGPSIHGTKPVVELLKKRGEVISDCLVGEPTSHTKVGDMVKIGRRGSLNTVLTIQGIQGHVAYPHLAKNPVSELVSLLEQLRLLKLDDGNAHFQPSNLEIVTIDVGNKTSNLIPEKAEARFNIRFCSNWSGQQLIEFLEKFIKGKAQALNINYKLQFSLSGDSFLTEPNMMVALLAESIKRETGIETELSTTGGTSDARFIKDLCPVMEFGVLNTTAHKVNEHVSVDDLQTVYNIYYHFLKRYFHANLES